MAHGGRVRDSSMLTGVPYPTLNDLYIGRSINPNLATLDALSAPYDIDASWFLCAEEPDRQPRTCRIVFLPPYPLGEVKRRTLREIQIPFSAWPMYEVFTELEERLKAMPADATRPIVAEASGDALPFRLATFLFQPLLAAEKTGWNDVFPVSEGDEKLDAETMARWTGTLIALGDMWKVSLTGFLSAPK